MKKSEMEAMISEAMIKFQKEQLGRGAESAKSYIIDDMILIRLKGVLTPAERQLARQEKGKSLIKEMRYQLEEIIRPQLEVLMTQLTGEKVLSLHNDISTKTGERLDVIVMSTPIQYDGMEVK